MFLSACNYKPVSEGYLNDIIVVASPEDEILIKPYIEDIFHDPIYTPQEENLFKLKWIEPWEIEEYKNYHNLILLSLNFPVDSTGDMLFERYKEAANTDEKIFFRENIYSNDQLFLSIEAFDLIDFKKNIDKHKNWIKNTYSQHYHSKNIKYVYSKGMNDELITYLSNHYKIKMDVQKDYMLIKESKNKDFIWFGRGYPYRWITILKIDDPFTWEEYINKINIHMPDISISENYRKYDIKHINNKIINVYRGIYSHDESETGGPFFIYEINNLKNQDKFLLSGYVNYPGHEKINLIKGIETLFNSFEIIN